MTTTKLTSDDIYDRLHTRYPAPEWAAFEELRDGPGFNQRRTVDFVAVNTWPSKGLAIVAVEVKVTRGDFRRELDHPEKRATVTPYVNEFWFAAPRGIVKPEEVPDGCGLLETWGEGKLRATIRARQFMDREPDRPLWTVIARRCAQDRERTAKHRQEFAEFHGRTVSIEDLRRLSKKLFASYQVKNAIRDEIRQEERDGRLAKHNVMLCQDWLNVLYKLWEHVRRVEKLKWDEKPSAQQAYSFLRCLKIDEERAALAARLRSVADELCPHEKCTGAALEAERHGI